MKKVLALLMYEYFHTFHGVKMPQIVRLIAVTPLKRKIKFKRIKKLDVKTRGDFLINYVTIK